MENIVILDASTLGDNSVFDSFKSLGNVRIYRTTNREERLEHIDKATIIVTNKVIIDNYIIENCPNLKLICLTATGMNNVDLQSAAEKNITVKNVAGYSTESVVQHTFALLLCMINHIEYYKDFVFSLKYSSQNIFTHIGPGFMELNGRTWGIIGLGKIGRRVAQIATAFGCNILYYSTSGKNSTTDYKQVSLQNLLQQSDIISIHAPLNKQTENLLTYKELCMMKETSYLINVGRGFIINEPDLAKTLQEKRIAGAAIDVMQTEPLPQNSPLLQQDIQECLIVTPHVAWVSDKALQQLIKSTYQNIKDFIEK